MQAAREALKKTRNGAEPIRLDPRVVELRNAAVKQIHDGDIAAAQATLSTLQRTGANDAAFEWMSAESLLTEPMTEAPWVVRGLEIGPGRPCGLWGLGGSGKSWEAKDIGLSVATGTKAFGRFDARCGPVSHVSHELGPRAVRERYRRLANARNLQLEDFGDRLRITCLPRLFLNSLGAEDVYAKTFERDTLVIIDSLRRALPGEDENDSSMSNFLDILNRVSAKTGVTFLVVHHTGKTEHDDKRLSGRGSSAILDGSGCVWLLEGCGKGPRKMTQIRPHDDGDGECPPFYVAMERVAVNAESFQATKPPIRLAYQDESEVTERLLRAKNKGSIAELQAAERIVLQAVEANDGIGRNALYEKIGDTKRIRTAIEALVESRRLVELDGPRNSKCLYLPDPK